MTDDFCNLSGRVALVTGAGQGMGLGIAKALAGRGAAVLVNDYFADRAERAAEELTAGGAQAMALPANLLEPQQVEAMINKAFRGFQAVDILVNNAGVPADGMVPEQFLTTEESEWRRYLELNLVAVMRCCRGLVPAMCQRGWGRVITIVSEAWRSTNGMGIAAYAAGKAGAVGFSRQLSGEVARSGVTVNCLSLGLMNNTGMEKQARAIPCGRLGCPEDVAPAVVYLASREAEWVTGQVLGINGGSIAG